jgi:CubicO group peptidase (beta-lactamase class C family)
MRSSGGGRRWAGVLLAGLAMHGLASAQAVPDAQALQSAMQTELTQQRLAGAAWALVDGETVRTGAAGLADQHTGQPLAPDAAVEVGSVAKPLLAMALLRAASQGRLSLDDTVQSRLPWLRIHNPWQATHPLRLHHLLDMTSGLEDIRLWQFFDRGHHADQPLRLALERDAGMLTLRSAPGTRFSYSNLGFTVAALMLEAAVGERYEPWMTRELLRPMGLRNSHVGPVPPGTRRARGHVEDDGPIAPVATAVRPATQLVTTAADLARLLQFVMAGDGRLDGQPFIHPALMQRLGHSPGTDAARAGLNTGYGLGWFTRDRHGAVGLCHGGSVAGWRAMACAWPAERRGFVVVHNHDREDADYHRFDALMVRALGVSTPALPASAEAVPPAERAYSGRYVAAPSRLWLMALPDHLAGSWVLDLHATPPTLAASFGPARPLVRLGPGLYRQQDRQHATLALGTDASGRPQLHGFGITLQPLGRAAFALHWAALLAGAGGLLWCLVMPPWRRWRQRRPLGQAPAFWAVLALIVALATLALQPWQALGERTLASSALWAATAALPLAALLQLALLMRRRREGASRLGLVLDTLAAGGLIALAALLAAYGLWPLALWRV